MSFLRYLFRPGWWVMLCPYSDGWDKRLNELLDGHEFEAVNEYSARIGGVELWIANHPYASMRPYNFNVRARRSTIERAHNKLMANLGRAKQ